jgi:hypothetical protein
MTCVYIAIVLLLLPYVLGPILIRQAYRVNPNPIATPVTTDAMSQEVRQYFTKHVAGLETLDYVPVAQFLIPDHTPGTAAYVWLWTNAKEKIVCAIHATYTGQGDSLLAKIPGAKGTTTYVELVTVFDNGFTIVTNNSPALETGRGVPQRDVAEIPDVDSAAVLHRVHAVRVARLKPAGIGAFMPPAGLEMEWFRKLLTDEAERQVGTGVFERDDTTTALRPTWPAAIGIALSQLPPYKQLRKFKRNERAEKELAAARGK